jgi:hypothetical protein
MFLDAIVIIVHTVPLDACTRHHLRAACKRAKAAVDANDRSVLLLRADQAVPEWVCRTAHHFDVKYTAHADLHQHALCTALAPLGRRLRKITLPGNTPGIVDLLSKLSFKHVFLETPLPVDFTLPGEPCAVTVHGCGMPVKYYEQHLRIANPSKLTTLELLGSGIDSVQQLKNATNLRSLVLRNVNVAQTWFIPTTSLTSLDCSAAAAAVIVPQLPELQCLKTHGRLCETSALLRLSTLQSLTIRDAGDFTFTTENAQCLTQLKQLTIDDRAQQTLLAKLEPGCLAALPNVTDICLDTVHVPAHLKLPPTLEQLKITNRDMYSFKEGNNAKLTLDCLAATQLRSLVFTRGRFANQAHLQQCRQLTRLELREIRVPNLKWLRGLDTLQSLSVVRCKVADVTGLTTDGDVITATGLTSLNLQYTDLPRRVALSLGGTGIRTLIMCFCAVLVTSLGHDVTVCRCESCTRAIT